jgi:hypothetical protein
MTDEAGPVPAATQATARQRLALVGGYPGGVWACAWCAAELSDGSITHRGDCRFLAEVAEHAAAAERARLAPLLTAYRRLFEVVWNETGTCEAGPDGYNLISYDDCNAIEEACVAVKALLASDDYCAPDFQAGGIEK